MSHDNLDRLAAELRDAEIDRLVTELHALPPHRGWHFSYEYPGYFCLRHADSDHSVWFTPDWEEDDHLPVQVQVGDGRDCPEYSTSHPLPREGRTGRQIFDLVRPTLDAILEATAGLVRVRLTAEEIASLPRAIEVVRAEDWPQRDHALSALGKVIDAAKEIS